MWRVLATEDDDWPSVVHNLRRARQKWERLTHILIREGADARSLGHIYLEVVQSLLLYGSEIWVLTPRMKRLLGGFRHRVARRLTGRQPWKGRDGGWFYPPMEDTMVEAGLQYLYTYVSRHQKTVAQYIATRTIMDLCLEVKRRPGTRLAMRWWEQEGLDLEGMRNAAWDVE